MKQLIKNILLSGVMVSIMSCADNSLETSPADDNFPLQLVLDVDEGGDLPDAEDYDLEVKFADYLPNIALPETDVIISYKLSDFEDDMLGAVQIDKIVYEVELEDCVYERELEFTTTGDTEIMGTIVLKADEDLGHVPDAFEIVFTLPALAETTGGFVFEIIDIETTENLILGSPRVFEYETLDHELAGEWELTITSAEEFDAWKEVFAPLSSELDDILFEDITGKITAEFEFEEMKWVIELAETEEITTCEDGESETEIENKVIEIEAEYDGEEGELEFEGSHVIIGDDGEPEDELDFIIESTYEVNNETGILQINFNTVLDEDNYEDGEQLFSSEEGYLFELTK